MNKNLNRATTLILVGTKTNPIDLTNCTRIKIPT